MPANVRTFLSAFGEDVELADASTIQGIYKTRQRVVTYDGTLAVERTHHVLWIPESLQGTLAQGQHVTVRGARFYIAATPEIRSGWLECVLTES